MKIEMGESLAASWLKHVKGCQFVQTNWKASPYWVPAVADKEMGNLYNPAVGFFEQQQLYILRDPEAQKGPEAQGENGKEQPENEDWRSMLSSAECDAVGVRFSHRANGLDVMIYAVESAFHRKDVNYSKGKPWWGARKTAWKIALKMFKDALLIYRWFGVSSARIVSITPKTRDSNEQEVEKACSIVQKFFNQNGFDFDLELYMEHAHGDIRSFNDEVLFPVRVASSIVNDTAELFMRAYILDKGIQGIDVQMLDLARQLLNVESLHELERNYLNAPQPVLEAINKIEGKLGKGAIFDRCHGALRAYYAAVHSLEEVPSRRDLEC